MVNLLESRRRILLATPHLESPTPANPLTFKTSMTTKLKEGKVYFTPVQEGTGDPSPDNVRPISGWDGIRVNVCGKNLLDPDSFTITRCNTINYKNGGLNGLTSSARAYSSYIDCLPNTTYTISGAGFGTGTNTGTAFYNENKEYISGVPIGNGTSHTFTTPDGAKFFRTSWMNLGDATTNDIQLELGSEVTSYEPYTGTTITIPFPQTIYGGYVDLVNGEVVEEYTAVTLDGENVKVSKGVYPSTNFYGAGWVYAKPSGLNASSNKIYMCDRLPQDNNVASTVMHYSPSYGGALYYRIRVLPKSDYPDELTRAEVINLTNEWLKTNPVTVAYPLATPIHHTIDPQVIKTLKGVNNIYSDANGNIEVKFWKH